jgi:hypothetical protein
VVNPKIIIGTFTVVLQFSAPVPIAMAAGNLTNIEICSHYPHRIMFSMAYPSEGDGSSPGDWVTRGWDPIDTGWCSIFDNALHVPTFYIRGVSVPFLLNGRSVTESWGDHGTNLKSFRVPNSYMGYNFWQADQKSTVQRGESFASFVIFYGEKKSTVDSGDADTVLTFEADGTITLDLTLKPNPPAAK